MSYDKAERPTQSTNVFSTALKPLSEHTALQVHHPSPRNPSGRRSSKGERESLHDPLSSASKQKKSGKKRFWTQEEVFPV